MEFEFNSYEAIEIYYYGFDNEIEYEFLSPFDVGFVDAVPVTFRT